MDVMEVKTNVAKGANRYNKFTRLNLPV
jgi:hypothetical protein